MILSCAILRCLDYITNIEDAKEYNTSQDKKCIRLGIHINSKETSHFS